MPATYLAPPFRLSELVFTTNGHAIRVLRKDEGAWWLIGTQTGED